MIDVALNQLVADVAHDVIVQTAPEELPIFQETSEAFFKDQDKLLKNRTSRDERLGFGPGAVSAVLMSPEILFIVNTAIAVVVEKVGETEKVKGLFGNLFHQKHEEKKVSLPLSQQQLGHVAEVVRATSLARGFSKEQGDQLTDTIIARLALGTS